MMKTPIDLLEPLERELEALRVKSYRAHSKQAVREIVEAIVSATPGRTIGLEDRPLIHNLDMERVLSREGRSLLGFSSKDRQKELEENNWASLQNLDIGLGTADYALADTGTLVLFSKKASGRWASLAPIVHIVLLPVGRILPSLDSLFAQWGPEKDLPALGSAVVFITGPSRTADIELKLVMGAHGPKELHVITLLFPV